MAKKWVVQKAGAGVPANEPAVLLDETYAGKMNIPDKIIVRFGSRKHTVRVAASPQKNSIRMTEHTLALLGLPAGAVVRAKYDALANTLHLGPLIGVIIRKLTINGVQKGELASFCRELSLAARQSGGVVCFFSPQDIGSDHIRAFVRQNGWVKMRLPYPDVVYNRLSSRKSENLPVVQTFFRDVKTKWGGHVFNERYLDKNEVFQALRHDPAVQKNLPETHPANNPQTIKEMCARYPTVYLKPIRGSLGKGIVRIARQSHGGYTCHFATERGQIVRSYPGFAQMYAVIAKKIKKSPHQIQQGLTLVSAGGRPIDFRALVQKKGKNAWSVTSIVARLAPGRQIVSNVARGGKMLPVKKALQLSTLPPGRISVVRQQLAQDALKIARSIEQNIKADFGELGIDLAVTADGRVWLLEVNSKPAKNDGTALGNRLKIRPSIKKIILYATDLANL